MSDAVAMVQELCELKKQVERGLCSCCEHHGAEYGQRASADLAKLIDILIARGDTT